MIDDVVRVNLDSAREIAVHDEVNPVAFIFMTAPNGECGIMMTGTGEFGPDEKDGFSDMLRGMVAVTGADAILFICEAWAVFEPSGDERAASDALRLSMEGRLSEHPDRVEVVHAIVETVDGGCTLYRAAISGDLPDREIGEFESTDASGMSGGRFADFFQRRVEEDAFRKLMSGISPAEED